MLCWPGNCKAVLGRTDTKSSSRLHAIALTTPASTRGSRHGSGLGLRHMQSMPAPLAASTPASPGPPEGLLGRDPMGEQPHATPAMSVHQLSSQDQFVVSSCSGSCLSTCRSISIAYVACICGWSHPTASRQQQTALAAQLIHLQRITLTGCRNSNQSRSVIHPSAALKGACQTSLLG